LPAVAVKALNRCRVRQLEARMAAGQRWQDSGFVFTTLTGTVLDPRNLTRTFKAILAAAGLIEERHWRAWKALRHPSAHGAVRQIDIRQTVAQSDLVFDLLLMLIFRVISYTGRYTDRTTKGWPLQQVPVAASD